MAGHLLLQPIIQYLFQMTELLSGSQSNLFYLAEVLLKQPIISTLHARALTKAANHICLPWQSPFWFSQSYPISLAEPLLIKPIISAFIGRAPVDSVNHISNGRLEIRGILLWLWMNGMARAPVWQSVVWPKPHCHSEWYGPCPRVTCGMDN